MADYTHQTSFDDANKMINDFLEIRKLIMDGKVLREDAPLSVKKYFSSDILSFVFYNKELYEYLGKLEKEYPLDPGKPEQFGIRIYFAADASGNPSLVMALCKCIGTGTTAQNITSAAGGVVQHPRIAPGGNRVQIETGDSAVLSPVGMNCVEPTKYYSFFIPPLDLRN